MTEDKTKEQFIKVVDKINSLVENINQSAIDASIDKATEFNKIFQKNPTRNHLLNLINKIDNIRIACSTSVSFPARGEWQRVNRLQNYISDFLEKFEINDVSFKQEQRVIQEGNGKFFRVKLTDRDCYALITNPENIAESLEAEFNPSTFIQFINNGLGTRYALMKKRDGKN